MDCGCRVERRHCFRISRVLQSAVAAPLRRRSPWGPRSLAGQFANGLVTSSPTMAQATCAGMVSYPGASVPPWAGSVVNFPLNRPATSRILPAIEVFARGDLDRTNLQACWSSTLSCLDSFGSVIPIAEAWIRRVDSTAHEQVVSLATAYIGKGPR